MCGCVGTLYYFGDNDRDGWSDLFNKYKFPPYEIPKLKPEISFGMAGKLVCVLLECFDEEICDWIYNNQPRCHILCFKTCHFEILKQLWFSCATL